MSTPTLHTLIIPILTKLPNECPLLAVTICALDIDQAVQGLGTALAGLDLGIVDPGSALPIEDVIARMCAWLDTPASEFRLADDSLLSPENSDKWDEICAAVAVAFPSRRLSE